jgi:hypothetical protein
MERRDSRIDPDVVEDRGAIDENDTPGPLPFPRPAAKRHVRALARLFRTASSKRPVAPSRKSSTIQPSGVVEVFSAKLAGRAGEVRKCRFLLAIRTAQVKNMSLLPCASFPPYSPEESAMSPLIDQLVSRIRQSTHNRIRDLSVFEAHGRVVVRGRVPSHHTKQLALHGILELLPGDRLHTEIAVA